MAQTSAVALSVRFAVFEDGILDGRLRAALDDNVDECYFAARFARREASVSSLAIAFFGREESGDLERGGQDVRICVGCLARFDYQRFIRQSALGSAYVIGRGVSGTCFFLGLDGRDIRLFFINCVTCVAFDFGAFDFMDDGAFICRFLFSVIRRSFYAYLDGDDDRDGASSMEYADGGYGFAFW